MGAKAKKKNAAAYWHGPARVVMTNPPSTVWVASQGSQVKAAPGKLQRAAEDELLILSGWIDALEDTRPRLEKEPKKRLH